MALRSRALENVAQVAQEQNKVFKTSLWWWAFFFDAYIILKMMLEIV